VCRMSTVFHTSFIHCFQIYCGTHGSMKLEWVSIHSLVKVGSYEQGFCGPRVIDDVGWFFLVEDKFWQRSIPLVTTGYIKLPLNIFNIIYIWQIHQKLVCKDYGKMGIALNMILG